MIVLSSDYHLGCVRSSHTTPTSRERLKTVLFEQALGILQDNREHTNFCLGDLFDSFWSDAVTLKQGKEIFGYLDLVLTGNHDRSNRSNAVSSMEFLEHISDSILEPAATNQPLVRHIRLKNHGVNVQWIDHKMTQALFDESLEMVEPIGGILLLHCNYNSGYATDESSLNLTKEQAETLLTKVDKIFLGHEHVSAEHFGGNLIILGNIHPTSFSDISDKYIWFVDEKLNITKECIWSERALSMKLDYKTLLQGVDYLSALQFIEVTGQAEPSELPKIARAIANLWKECPNALMIKNAVTTLKQEAEQAVEIKVADTITAITNELKNTKLYPVWEHYREQLNN